MKSTVAHGLNIGHGYVKHVVIDPDGREHTPVVFPALLARAGAHVEGSLSRIQTVAFEGGRYWVGEDALSAPTQRTILAQERLRDPAFIPILVRSALARQNGATAHGYCVTGLPATWAGDSNKAKLLGERLRAATDRFTGRRVIAEPLGLVYSILLDTNGKITGDQTLSTGRIAVVDLGHHTVDVAVVDKLTPLESSLDTWQLGSAHALTEIRARLSGHFERELSLYETDRAVRAETLRIAGIDRPLPHGWDRSLHENGFAIAARMMETWGSGAKFDAILLGGGGAEEQRITTPIMERFPHAMVVEQPQTAIARGYARLARRLGGA